MIKLYDTYTDEDLVFLIDLKKGGKIQIILENDFELTDTIEEEYAILAYSPAYEILNNGYRHLYEKKIEKDLSNIRILYDEEDILSEVGIIADNEYFPVYVKYTLGKIKEHIKSIIEGYSEYIKECIIREFKTEGICQMGLLYYYDGETIDLNLRVGTEGERRKLTESGQDNEYLGNYSKKIDVCEKLEHSLATLILSIQKDGLADEEELLEHIVGEIDKKLHSVDWNKKIVISEDFIFKSRERYY